MLEVEDPPAPPEAGATPEFAWVESLEAAVFLALFLAFVVAVALAG
jgi:hypothetical protein